MAATVKVAAASAGLSCRVRVSAARLLVTPNGAAARVRVASASLIAPQSAPARVRVSAASLLVRPLLDGTPLLREFDGARWVPIPGQLGMFTEAGAWVPC